MTPNTPIMPLDFWRQEMQYNPWHFWGLADANIVPVTSKCNDVVREYGWQENDQAGRADIRAAIMNAESILFDNLEYWPLSNQPFDSDHEFIFEYELTPLNSIIPMFRTVTLSTEKTIRLNM